MYRFLSTTISICRALFLFLAVILIAPQPALADIDSSLIGYYPFEEGSGGGATNLAGGGYDITFQGTVTWTAGRIGGGILLDSIADYGDITGNFGPPSAATIAVWVNESVYDEFTETAVNIGDGLTLYTKSGSNGVTGQYASGGCVWNDTPTAVSVEGAGWKHLVYVVDPASSRQEIWIDGVLQAGATTFSSAINHSCTGMSNSRIGQNPFDFGNYQGNLDELRVYSRALTPGDIAELYAYTGASALVLSKPPNNLGLVGYWSFNEGSGTIATDFSGNRHAGVLSSSGSVFPTWVNGKRGKALSFDGDEGHVDIPAFNRTLLPATFLAWVKVESGELEVCDGLIFSRSTVISGINIAGCADATRLGYHWNDGGFGWSGPLLPIGKWFLVAMVVESTQVTMYAYSSDGYNSAVDSTAQTASLIDRLEIGRDDLFGDREMKGLIDEVRIYRRALTSSEIRAMYESGVVRFGSSVDLQRGSSLEQGLVGHWTFDGADTGTTIADRSGQGNNGYYYNGATSSVKRIGKLGQALDFNGSTQYVNAGSGASLQLTGAMTACAWVKPESIATTGLPSPIITRSTAGAIAQYVFDLTADNEVDLTWTNDGGTTEGWVTNDDAISLGVWQHVCTSRASADSVAMYVNGVSRSVTNTGGAAITTTSANTAIGTAGDLGTYFFDGFIDDVRLYNRALTPTEVKQLYQLGQVRIVQ